MNVRRAAEKDVPKLLDLLTQVDMVHHAGRPDLFNGPAQKYSPAELRAMLSDDQNPIFVAVDDADAVLGYAMCQTRQVDGSAVLAPVKTLYLDDLCVDETARGKHVGQTLYEYVVRYARETGCYNVTLHVWACNPDAAAFYQKMGLRPQYTCLEQIL